MYETYHLRHSEISFELNYSKTIDKMKFSFHFKKVFIDAFKASHMYRNLRDIL